MGNCSKHPRLVPGFDSIDQVVSTVFMFDKNLTIDLINELASDYFRQSKNDRKNKRVKLAEFLEETSNYLFDASSTLNNSVYFSKHNDSFLPKHIYSIKQLAFNIGNLQYDVAVEFFSKYSVLLPPASKNISDARNSLQKAWDISEPYM